MAYKRTTHTSKGTGNRRTTTHNRKTGTTHTTSFKNGKHGRITYTTDPKGRQKVTRTYTAGGYTTRTTKSLTPKTPKVKKIKTKVYKPPKPPKIRSPKITRPKTYRPKKIRFTRSRSRSYGTYNGSSGGTGILWLALAFFIILVIVG